MNLNILFIDKDILVVEKPAGIAVQTGNLIGKDLVSELKNHLSRQMHKPDPYLGIIHRLDQPVRGILVFALNEKAAAVLSEQIKGAGFNKCYRAMVEGIVETSGQWGILTDHLVKDKDNIARVTDKEDKRGKMAELRYKTLWTDKEKNMTMLEIELITGRFHQIRAQLSNMGHPIVNDVKYGAGRDKSKAGDRSIALNAYKLSFIHPVTKKREEYALRAD